VNWGYVLLGLGFVTVSFLVTAAAITLLLICLPPTYFLDSYCRRLWIDQHQVIRWTGIILKNLSGVIIILVGGILSVPGVPGQGVLTILLGLVLLDFPGKRRLERAILARPRVQATVNRLRARFGKLPFVLDESPSSTGGSPGHRATDP
jgi:hypothetical protein